MTIVHAPLLHASVNEARAPAPPVAEYKAWLEARNPQGGGLHKHCLSATLLRRLVTLRRAGDTWAEIARCVHMENSGGVKAAWLRLPESLR